jgi:hypothetical protein
MTDYGMVYIKSSWFDQDEGGKKNKFKQIGLDGFILYFHILKRRYHQYDRVSYHIETCISRLAKDTKRTSKEVFETLLHLKKLKVIQIEGHSRKEYYYDNKGLLKKTEMLNITAIDVPDTSKEAVESGEKDHFIPVDMSILLHYLEVGLPEKYFPFYCLLRKLSNGRERKAFMKMENMAHILGYGKNLIQKMIIEMNRHHLLYSHKKQKKKGRTPYEHHLCWTLKDKADFELNYGKKMDAFAAKWDKKRQANKGTTELEDEQFDDSDIMDMPDELDVLDGDDD